MRKRFHALCRIAIVTITLQQAIGAFLVVMFLGCFLSRKKYGVVLAVGMLLVVLALIWGNAFVQALMAFVHR